MTHTTLTHIYVNPRDTPLQYAKQICHHCFSRVDNEFINEINTVWGLWWRTIRSMHVLWVNTEYLPRSNTRVSAYLPNYMKKTGPSCRLHTHRQADTRAHTQTTRVRIRCWTVSHAHTTYIHIYIFHTHIYTVYTYAFKRRLHTSEFILNTKKFSTIQL